MKAWWALVKRELWSYLVSPVSYFVFTIFSVLSGYFFFNLLGSFNFAVQQESQMPVGELGRNLNLNEGVIEGYYHTLLILLIFIIPLTTMRAISEERQRGTFEMLLTSTVSVSGLVLAKLTAYVLQLSAILSVALLYVLVLCLVAGPEILPALCGAAGLYLAVLTFTAIGIFFSAAFSSSLLAGVSTLAVLLLLYGMHTPANSLDGWWLDFFRSLSSLWHARLLFRGLLDLGTVFYFCSITVLAVGLAMLCVRSERLRGL